MSLPLTPMQKGATVTCGTRMASYPLTGPLGGARPCCVRCGG
jgi:hypothetical protein